MVIILSCSFFALHVQSKLAELLIDCKLYRTMRNLKKMRNRRKNFTKRHNYASKVDGPVLDILTYPKLIYKRMKCMT